MILRASLIAVHAGVVLGPALVLTAFAATGTDAGAFPRLIASGEPWVIAVLVLAVAQAVVGSLLGLRNLKTVTPVGVHVIGPTLIAWVGLAGSALAVAAAGDAARTSSGDYILEAWATSLASADLARQYGFLTAGWGWLAALASVTLGAFARRGGAPRKPGLRLALIAVAGTLPAVVLFIGGDMVAIRSGIYLIATALAAGGLMALAIPTVSVWSVSDDPPSRSLAFSTIWLCGCAAVVTVAMQGLAMAWQAQSAALNAAVADSPRLGTTVLGIASSAARAQMELSTEFAYLCAGLALTWLALAMRGRRVVFSAPSQHIGSVLMTLLLACSIGVANNLYEQGANRRHADVLAMDKPLVADELDLPIAPLPEVAYLPIVVRIDGTSISVGDTRLASHSDGAWQWRDDANIAATPIPRADGTPEWQRQLCTETDRAVAVAASGSSSAGQLLEGLAGLRSRGICLVQLLARRPDISSDRSAVSAWVGSVVARKQRAPLGISFFLAHTTPEGAVVVIVDAADPPKPTIGDPVALEWHDDLTVAQALTLAPAPYAVLLLPGE